MDNNLNINSLNNMKQHNASVEHPKILEQSESTEQITTGEAQYRYLKELNKKLILFKKNDEQSGKKDEETKQTIREIKNEFY